MTQPAHSLFTYEEYLVACEASPNVRLEFLDGQVYAMAGGTPEHAAVCSALAAQLGSLLGTPCRSYSSDLRVLTPSGLSTYPDVTIVCGRAETSPKDKNAVINPGLIVEVLSPGTAAYDQGAKFEHYKSLPSLHTYLLIDPMTRTTEWWSRDSTGKGWGRIQHANIIDPGLRPGQRVVLNVGLLFSVLD